jgi:hypothetical protein
LEDIVMNLQKELCKAGPESTGQIQCRLIVRYNALGETVLLEFLKRKKNKMKVPQDRFKKVF